MKNRKIFIAILLLLSIFLSVNIYASKEYSWFCKREKDHKTPQNPAEFNFIYEYSAYSYDKSLSSYTDNEKVIYLTFDAGYENGNVEKTLDILKEEKVTAAFFVLGNLIENNTHLITRMIEEGHLVCNHTYSHKNMSNANDEELMLELKKLENIYKQKTGKNMLKYYRPPEGRFSRDNLAALSKAGYKTIFWSFAYADWDNNNQPSRENALKKLTDNLHNGEIMLLHPTSSTNTAILKEFINYAKNEGFRFASLEELK